MRRTHPLDPETARFTTQDAFGIGKIDSPPSLHLYMRANDNPTRFVDPTGHWSWEETKDWAKTKYEQYRTWADKPYTPPDAVWNPNGFADDMAKTTAGYGKALGGAVVGAGVAGLKAITTVGKLGGASQPLGMEDSPVAPFSGKDVEAAKTEVKFYHDTLANLPQTGPWALDAIQELGAEKSGQATGGALVTTVSAIEGGAGIVRGGFSLARAGSGLLKGADGLVVGEGLSGPQITRVRAGNNPAGNPTILPGGTGKAFAGHGGYGQILGEVEVPPGTTLTIPVRPGLGIPESLGQAIERGAWDEIAANPAWVARMEGAASYLPGAKVPNLVLAPGDAGMTMYENSVRVQEGTSLSDLLKPNQGHMCWAACLKPIF